LPTPSATVSEGGRYTFATDGGKSLTGRFFVAMSRAVTQKRVAGVTP
jgi:hypothetical protein